MDSDKLYRQAEDLRRSEDAHEKDSWYRHPLTRALVLRLRAGREDILERWEEGLYTHETIDATALKNAHVLAVVQTFKDVLEEIADIANSKEEE